MMVNAQNVRFLFFGCCLACLLLGNFNPIYAQNNDCDIAEVVCDGSNIDYTPSGPGNNDFQDPDNNSGCLVSQENQSAWYYFEFSPDMPPNSTIEFDIQPFGGLGEDYDFAVFGPNVDCGNLGSPIRCSYASANCSFCPNTGVGNGTSDQSEGPSGDGYVSAITVQPGEGYYLLVDNYNNSSNGFSLGWGGSGAPYLDCNAEPPCAGLGITVTPNAFAFCENEAPFTLDVVVSGGPLGMEYVWSGTYANNLSNVNILNPVLTPPPGFTGDMTFDLTITEGNCIEVYPISVTINPVPVAEAGDPLVIDCNNPSVTLTSNGSTTGPNILYTWSLNGQPAGSGQSIEITEEGLYTLTVSNQLTGCSATDDVLVTDNSIPPVAAGDAFGEITCYTPEVVMGVLDQSNPNATYEWYDGSTLIGDGTEVIVNAPGTYSLVVTDQSNGCSSSTFITVIENTIPPYANPEATNAIDCINPISAIIATNAFPFDADFQWYFNGEYFDAGPFITAYEPGVYTMIMTDLYNGCTYEDTTIVSETPSNVVSAPDLPEPLTCNQSTVTLNVGNSSSGSNISYSWQNENGAEISTDVSVVVFEAGAYTLVVTDNTSGCTADSTFLLAQDITPPQLNALAEDSITCLNTTVPLIGISQPADNISIQWTDEDGNVISDSLNALASSTGLYNLSVVNLDNGCLNSTSVEVIQNIINPNADAGPNDTITCLHPTLTLDASNSSGLAPLTFSWSLNNEIVGNESTLETALPGTYTLIVTNAGNGCTDSDKVTLLQNTINPIAEAAPDSSLSCLFPELQLQGATPVSTNHTVQWTDENGLVLSDSLSFLANTPGSYLFTVVNLLNGCTTTDTTLLSTNDQLPDVQAGSDTLLTCTILNIELSGTGSSGNGQVSFAWEDELDNVLSDSASLQVQVPGTYTFIVTDLTNGCSAADLVVVNQDIQSPVADAGSDGILTCLTGTVSLNGSNSSSGLDITYDWQDENQESVGDQSNILVSDPGTYILFVTNQANGCFAADTVTVTPDSETPVAKITGSTVLNCLVDTLLLSGAESTQGTSMTNTWLDQNGDIAGSEPELEVYSPQLYYFIVANTNNGCADTATVEVTENIQAPTAAVVFSTDNVISCSQPLVEVTGSQSGGIGQLVYNWQAVDGNTLSTADSLPLQTPGNYVLLVTDSENGCTDSMPFDLVDDTTPPLANAGNDGILTCADAFYALDGSSSTTGIDIAYTWLNATGDSIDSAIQTNVIVAGTYILEVLDTGNGCLDTDTIVIIPDSNLPVAIGSVSGILNCVTTTVTLNSSGSAAGPDITYAWLDPSGNLLTDSPSVSIQNPGSYSLIVTNNANGCSTTAFVPVVQDTLKPMATTVPKQDTLTCTYPLALLIGNSSTPGGTLTKTWIDEQGNSLSTADSFSTNIEGTYLFIVSNQINGCKDTATTFIVADNQSPLLSAGKDTALTCTNPSLTLSGFQPDSTLLIGYQWKNENQVVISTTSGATVTQPGKYYLLATNLSNGCQSLDSLQVSQNITPPVADAGQPVTLNCLLTTHTLGGSNTSNGSAYTYQWTDSDGAIIGTDMTAQTSVPNDYALLVTNIENGCTASATVTIDQNVTLPPANAGANKTLTCIDTTFQVGNPAANSNLNLLFEWTNDAGQVLNDQPSLLVNTPGVYTLHVTDITNGCSQSDQVSIIANNQAPDAVATSNGNLTCTKTSVSLNGGGSTSGSGGNLQFEWKNPQGQPTGSSSATLATIPGSFILSVTDASNGCVDMDTIVVVQNIQQPIADAGNTETLTCAQTTLTLDASNSQGAQLQYTWLSSSQLPLGSNAQLAVTQPDSYTLIVTDGINGCKDTTQLEILQNTVVPAVVASNTGDINCNTPVTLLDGTGSSAGQAFEYTWVNTAGDTLASSLTVQTNQAGNFFLTVTDITNGCTATATTSLSIDTLSPLVISTAPELLTCVVASTTLDGSASSGASSLSFSWLDSNNTNLSGTSTVEVSTPGTYTLVVTDDTNGCSGSQDIIVNQDIEVPQSVITTSATEITCDQPSITLSGTASNPVGGITFSWIADGSPVSSSSEIVVTDPGTYSLLVTNSANGCTNISNTTITENTVIPQVLISTPNIITCYEETATLDGSGSSNGATFSYTWAGPSIISGAQSTIALAGAAGTYTLTVLNTENGCQNQASTNVIADQEDPLAFAKALDVVDCFNNEARLSGAGSSEGPTMTYLWTSTDGILLEGANTLTPLAGSGGTYLLLVTNTGNGCTATAETNVISNTNPPENALTAISNPACFGDENGSITVQEVSGGTPPYLFSLNGSPFSAGLPDYTNLGEGSYLLAIQDVNGCEWSETYVLTQPDSMTATLGEELYIDLGTPVSLELIVNRPDDQLQLINWTSHSEKFCRDSIYQDCRALIDTPFTNTLYSVLVTDSRGCTALADILVRVNQVRPLFIPNAFSPDGDGRNDKLVVFGGNNIRNIVRFSIFDRWGETMFQQNNFQPNDPDYGWDGDFKGNKMDPGVYIYYAEVEFIDGEVILFKGSVTLVR